MFQQTPFEDMILFNARNLEVRAKSSFVRNKIYEENMQKKNNNKISLAKMQVLTATIAIQ